ncbi:ADP-binding protein [Alloiococcus otitis]|uniref:tRNA threonylcarbamoyladenosine biosynthesis protein TsaE n=1 Tax=Alloiococcus otitis ATCC 51267 TaxID=883081 RepID=K9E7R2_9LACT|nr:tRNA (adenosine(37)-N6)-threonylcarbamoyltransferase complex ATPase subunit type 1 TsaE [Alloiococcus otitis]EKU93249.1 YjeE family ATPase [Alloiococcus otitis ATCC 51267]SUU80587.1 ADP-binding protein [Alloiococcus otitis]
MKEIQVKDQEGSYKLAQTLAQYVKPGMVFLLEGDLGAGKTTFTKGLAQALHIDRMIKSPTYTIIREYQGGDLPLYHMDLYRLDLDMALDLGLEEYFDGPGLCVVEWPSQAMEAMPRKHLKITIKDYFDQAGHRTFYLQAEGEAYQALLDQVHLDE